MSKTVFLLQRTLSQSRKLCQPGSIWSPPWPGPHYWVPNLIGENIPPTSFPNCPNCCAQHLTQLSLVINAPNLNCSGRGFVKKKGKGQVQSKTNSKFQRTATQWQEAVKADEIWKLEMSRALFGPLVALYVRGACRKIFDKSWDYVPTRSTPPPLHEN